MDVNGLAVWLQAYIADKCKIPAGAVGCGIPFDQLGVDSIMAVGITVEIDERYGVELPPTALFEFNTIDALVEQVGELYQMQAE
jgi:hypothetical protein